MTTDIMKSQLNPLAETFVPSQYTKNDSVSENKTLAKNENNIEFENVKAPKNVTKSDALDMLMLKIQRLGINVELLLLKKSIFKDDLFNWITSLPKVLASQSFVSHLDNSTNSDLEVKSKCSNIQEVREEEIYSSLEFQQMEKEECNCPAIFGWIVPPDFFGNPLKLQYKCNKRYAHISSPVYNFNCANDREAHDLKTNEFKSEVEDDTEISGSVCGDSSPPELEKLNDSIEIKSEADLGTLKEDNLIRNPALDLETSVKLDLIDDGCHPLLQSDTFKICEKDECLQSIQQTEKILGKSLFTHERTGNKSPEKSACNPPCSVWCEHCPRAAKDTFKKFLKEMESKDSINFGLGTKLIERPRYLRSYSANDALICEFSGAASLHRSSSISDELAMFGRYSSTSFKSPLSFFKTGSRKYLSKSGAPNDHLREFNNTADNGCNKWGPFDGADSLWKPLPECVPNNDYNQKHINHKRAREMKRQRSLS